MSYIPFPYAWLLAPPTGVFLNPIWHIYLIECVDGSLYTGIATDVESRFRKHLSGKGARYTRSHKPLRLVVSRPVGSRSEALRAELAIKRLPKEKKQAALISPELIGAAVAGATFKTAVAGKKAAKKK